MWNDRETDIDLIGHSIIAEAITDLIHDPKLLPLTIGVYGDWGVGKSSVLKMITKNCNTKADSLCINFNGWLFQGYDDAKSILMEVIIRELQNHRTITAKGQELVRSLIKRVDWLRVAQKGAGIVASSVSGIPIEIGMLWTAVDQLKNMVNPSAGIPYEDVEKAIEQCKELCKPQPQGKSAVTEIGEFRSEFQQLLQETKIKQLVILVDDLDRCLPQAAIAALEAIRLFLFVPGTAFIIAADEEMIVQAVKKHYIDLPTTTKPIDYSRSYLEKLIQVPFRIPTLNPGEVQNYVCMLLLEIVMDAARFEVVRQARQDILSKPWLLNQFSIEEMKAVIGNLQPKEAEAISIATGIAMQLTDGLSGNPRQIKRFLNTLMLRHRIAQVFGIQEVLNLPLLAKIMLLEQFRGEIYLEIMKLAAQSPMGKIEVLFEIEKSIIAGQEPELQGFDEADKARKWLQEPWFIAWIKMQPMIGNLDIRSYAYISKDRSLGYSLEIELGESLGKLAAELLSGIEAKVIENERLVKELPANEAKRLFTYMESRASNNVDWRSMPNSVKAMFIIAKNHTLLQSRILEVLDKKPSVELGMAIVAKVNDAITDSQLNMKKEALFLKWSNATDNSTLKNTAKAKLGGGH